MDSEQLLSLNREVPEEGASVRNPENGSEDLDDVRTRLDAILGVLSGGGRSSTGGGSDSERHRRDPSIGGRSSEKGRKQSTPRSSESSEDEPPTRGSLRSARNEAGVYVKMKLSGVEVPCLMDTGCEVTMVPQSLVQ